MMSGMYIYSRHHARKEGEVVNRQNLCPKRTYVLVRMGDSKQDN